MSNWGFDDANDGNPASNNEQPGGGGLRQFAENQQAENKALKDQLAAIQAELSRQKVESTLSQLGIPAEAASQYRGENDPEKVREWATTMQSIFGGAQPQQAAPVTTSGPVTPMAPAPTLPDSMAQQFQRMSEAGASGQGVGNADALAHKIADANSIQDLIGAWKTTH
jgi:crotonobetainyl-CoA:carnitine CoA-transferase CaiB-like acyl-CoA transferase